MDADNLFIQCSTHGALFKPGSGECIAGPCQGDSLAALFTFVWAAWRPIVLKMFRRPCDSLPAVIRACEAMAMKHCLRKTARAMAWVAVI